MTIRIYVSAIEGDGQTMATAYRPVWRGLVGDLPSKGVIASEVYFYWLGQIDTSDAEHAILVADPRVRHIPTALLSQRIVDLSQAQRTAALEVLTFVGADPAIFSNQARVKDVLFYLIGRNLWRGVPLTEGQAVVT